MAANNKISKKKLLDSKRKLITKYDPKSPISEQYRTIRTNVLFSSVDEEIRTLMVTSSGPGEGKSTTAANLAVVFAQQGKTVLLIDADLRKPTVHYTFNLINTIGLTSVLTNQSSLREAVQKSDESKLYILPSGPIPPNPSELLGSKAMQQFIIEKALEEFDIVIFDTPPVLAVTDAQILANLCQGTLLVASSGSTEKDNLVKTKELLSATKGKILGIVLNNRKQDKKSSYYYYGTN